MKLIIVRTISSWLFLIAPFAFGVGNVRADTPQCSNKEALAAEKEASMLRSWDALYRSYGKYYFCDDGAISEGYSYSVAWLLSERWIEFDKLIDLTKKSRHFEDFVVSHINETMSQDEAARILNNLAKCPVSGKRLCGRLRDAIFASS